MDVLPLKRIVIVKELKWLKIGRLFITQKSNQTRSTAMGANPRDGNFFIVRICVRFADAVYQKGLIIVQIVMSTCVKPYQDLLNWRLKQVKLLRNFVIKKCEQANSADSLCSPLIFSLGEECRDAPKYQRAIHVDHSFQKTGDGNRDATPITRRINLCPLSPDFTAS